uniref:VirB8/TrbF family protein n=1 Tax=Bilophila sp. TaxID=1929485 RepID=UPI003076BD3A
MKEQENPYLNARKKHNEYEGGLIASRHIWQMFGILGLLVGLAGVGGMVHIGSQSKFVPYVIEGDTLGPTHGGSCAARAAPADPRVIHSLLARAVTL